MLSHPESAQNVETEEKNSASLYLEVLPIQKGLKINKISLIQQGN
jgi:hypothetical protein